jgi:signal transduction histidine kinase
MIAAVNRSLRAKVTFGIILPLLTILGIFTVIEHTRHNAVTQENLAMLASYSGKIVESNLRHAMLEDDFTEVRALLDTIGSWEQFEIVYVMDTSGEVIFAPNGEGIGTQLDLHEADCQLCHSLPADKRPSSVVLEMDDGQQVFRSMYPLENQPECARCHDTDDRILGLLLTDITMAPVESVLSADLRENLLWWIGAIIVTVIVVNLVMSHFVLRRLEALATGIAGLGKGQLPPPLPEKQADEIGQLAIAFNLMVRQIEARNQENEELSETLRRQSVQRGELLKRVITAQEDERSRVARELHDELGQSLSGLALGTEAMERLISSDPERAKAHLEQLRSLVAATTDQMYDLILALRPSALDDLGLVVALRSYADRMLSPHGIAFEITVDGLTDRLPPTTETALYRIFQEALSNILRHSAANQVRIELKRQDDDFEGSIVDNGVGFDPGSIQADGSTGRGLGLLGMRERVEQCGGHLQILSTPGQGTRLILWVPLEDKDIFHG